MRLKIRHVLASRFDEPASLVRRSLKMSPRTYNGQYVRSWRIEVDHDCRQNRSSDAFGNTTHDFALSGAVHDFVVVAAGEVEVDDTAGVLKGTLGDRMPVSVYLRETPLTVVDPAIRELAAAVKAESDGNTLDVCHRLMDRLHAAIAPEPVALEELVGVATTSASACLEAKTGSPVALAHLYIAAARSLAIPARFVSGYIHRGDERDRDAAAHAWAEALIPGLGWVGFDAENNTCPTGAYIRVAGALDQAGGGFARGADRGATAKVEATVSVELVAI